MKLSVKLAAIMIAMVSISICNSVAHANDLLDELNDWSLTSGHTNVLTLDNGNSQNFRGDTSRVKCEDLGSGSFFYHVPNVRSFAGTVYYFQQQPGSIEVYSS